MESLHLHLDYLGRTSVVRWTWYTWYLLGNVLFITIYALILDPRRVYTPDIPIWVGAILVIFISVLVNGVSLYFFYLAAGKQVHHLDVESGDYEKQRK